MGVAGRKQRVVLYSRKKHCTRIPLWASRTTMSRVETLGGEESQNFGIVEGTTLLLGPVLLHDLRSSQALQGRDHHAACRSCGDAECSGKDVIILTRKVG